MECILRYKKIITTIHQSLFTFRKWISYELHFAEVHNPNKSRVTMKEDIPNIFNQSKLIKMKTENKKKIKKHSSVPKILG